MSVQKITDFEAGQRLDKELATVFPDYSRSTLEKLITSGNVQINNKQVKSKYLLKANDIITIDFSELTKELTELDLSIIYEDDNVVVVDKPAGVLAHSKGVVNNESTVASWLKAKYGDDGDFWQTNRSGIVHRLDRATSGVMICAKNTETQKHLQKQFSSRKVKKTYLALVSGHLKESEAIIKLPIERNPKRPQLFRVGAGGKTAETHYKTIKQIDNNDLVELKPKTGRTHQLRVHMDYLGHPIIGDHFYNPKGKTPDLCLQASQLEITLPGGIRKTFKSKTITDFHE